MVHFKNILLPTDFGESSLRATEYAVELTKRFSARLHLLHVIEDPLIDIPIFASHPLPSYREFEQYAQTRLENWVLPDDRGHCDLEFAWVHCLKLRECDVDLQQLKYDPEIARERSRPWSEILSYAYAQSIDLIVMGTCGRRSIVRHLFGSKTARAIRLAPCPVLTVPLTPDVIVEKSN